MVKVLVVGSGGREHALAWRLHQSAQVQQVFVAPGNAGTALAPGIENCPIPADDITGMARFAHTASVALTVVGPEAPLAAGMVDYFKAQGLPCFGPTQAAAQLESSKAFAKALMQRQGIPTAAYQVFTDHAVAWDYVQSQSLPLVIKADGLAAGKGVIIATTQQEAKAALDAMLLSEQWGQAGARVVIESYLVGEEVSFIAVCDGKTILPLSTSQDHKARDVGDSGPNTGGMGAYSPVDIVTAAMHQQIMDTVMRPVVSGLADQGIAYVGFLYAGLMLTAHGPRVLEFNCRLGDPEAQPLMLRFQSDLYAVLQAAVQGKLSELPALQWDPRVALGVVMAAQGYPHAYPKGDVVHGLTALSHWPDCRVFHAGTQMDAAGQVRTAGGRVLCVTALGETVCVAQAHAYRGIAAVTWPHAYYRSDIGYRAVDRLKKKRNTRVSPPS